MIFRATKKKASKYVHPDHNHRDESWGRVEGAVAQ